MKRVARWCGIIAVALLLLLLSVPLWIDAASFRPVLESKLSAALAREVRLGELKLTVLAGSVTASDLAIGDDPAFGALPFVRAKSLKLQVELWPLIASRRLNVTGLTIDQPEITLLASPSGRWNFSSLGAQRKSTDEQKRSSAPLDLAVKLVKIANGRFSVGTIGKAKPLVLEEVNIELRDFSSTSVFPFSLSARVAGGGDIRLQGKAGPIAEADVVATPAQAGLKITRLDLADSGLGGLVSFDGSGESKDGVLHVAGRLQAENLKLVRQGTAARRVVALDFALQHDLRKQAGVLRRADIHIGKALATLTGSYGARGESTEWKLALTARDMPIPELAEMLPAMGIALPAGSSLQGGTATAGFLAEGPIDNLVTSGTVAFQHTTLAGFDLGGKLSVIERLAGIKRSLDTEIETLSAKVKIAPDGISAEEIRLLVPAIGELGGGGTVSPARALDFRMTAALHTAGLLTAMNDRPVPFLVSGTCSEPVFRPDVKAAAAEQLRTIKQGAGKAAGNLLKGLLGGKKD